MFADAVSALLTRDGRFDVVGTATHTDEAVELAGREEPNVVLMDLTMPGADAVDTARRLREASPRAWLSKDEAHRSAPDVIASVAAAN